MALGRRLSSGDVPAPTNWRARAQHRRRYGLIWATVVIIVSSYFGSLVVVRAFDSDDVTLASMLAEVVSVAVMQKKGKERAANTGELAIQMAERSEIH